MFFRSKEGNDGGTRRFRKFRRSAKDSPESLLRGGVCVGLRPGECRNGCAGTSWGGFERRPCECRNDAFPPWPKTGRLCLTSRQKFNTISLSVFPAHAGGPHGRAVYDGALQRVPRARGRTCNSNAQGHQPSSPRTRKVFRYDSRTADRKDFPHACGGVSWLLSTTLAGSGFPALAGMLSSGGSEPGTLPPFPRMRSPAAPVCRVVRPRATPSPAPQKHVMRAASLPFRREKRRDS